jgi:hypothetical protein
MKEVPPILEFDSTREAIIEPSKAITSRDLPKRCVFCFSSDVINSVCSKRKIKPQFQLKLNMNTISIYPMTHEQKTIAIAQCPMAHH